VGHASRSNDLLWLKISRASVYQPGLKTGGGTARMMHVTLSWRLRRVET
jgi:hypothetical protein